MLNYIGQSHVFSEARYLVPRRPFLQDRTYEVIKVLQGLRDGVLPQFRNIDTEIALKRHVRYCTVKGIRGKTRLDNRFENVHMEILLEKRDVKVPIAGLLTPSEAMTDPTDPISLFDPT